LSASSAFNALFGFGATALRQILGSFPVITAQFQSGNLLISNANLIKALFAPLGGAGI
jgi:hypothetical protein